MTTASAALQLARAFAQLLTLGNIDETARDAVANALTGSDGLSFAINDAGDSITIGVGSPATLRTKLALGTAALMAGGVGANQLLQLDGGGKVPTANLPDSVVGALKWQGAWNASTNSPAIPSAATANKGWYYRVGTAGSTTIDGESDWKVGDWIVSNGAAWEKLDATDAVTMVAGLVGNITPTALAGALASYFQAADADLAAIAALATTEYGRSLLTLSNQAALQAAVGGSAAMVKQTFAFGSTDVGAAEVQYFYAATDMTVKLKAIGGTISWQKSTAADPTTFGTASNLAAGATGTGITLEAGASLKLQYFAGGLYTTWAYVEQTA